MKEKKFTLAQVAEIAGGKIVAGFKTYELYGLAPIWSAKDHYLTVIATAADVQNLTPDVRAVVCDERLKPFLEERVPQIVVVKNAREAAEKLREAFTKLTLG